MPALFFVPSSLCDSQYVIIESLPISAEESTRSIAPPSREIKVNSIVLAARSDFFRTMLQSGMREGCRDKPPIVLNVLKEGEAIIES